MAARKVEAEQYDLAETPLAAMIDDARAMSLFASERLIFVIGAEAAMPRSAEADDDDEGCRARRPARAFSKLMSRVRHRV